MIPVKVTKISFHPPSRSYAVILKEITGDRYLPVIVGSFEAQSIALAIEVVDTPRPLTHDLICDIITGVDGNLKTIKISNLDDGVFYAKLELESEKLGMRVIDARPSDAVAVALRMNAPILVSPDIMNKAGVDKDAFSDYEVPEKKSSLSLEGLKEKLNKAIESEDYEIAAKIRDKISEMES